MIDPTTREALAKVAHDHWGYSSDSPGEYECDCGELTKNPQEHIALKIIEASGFRPAHEVAEECAQIADETYDEELRAGKSRYDTQVAIIAAIRAAFPASTEERTDG